MNFQNVHINNIFFIILKTTVNDKCSFELPTSNLCNQAKPGWAIKVSIFTTTFNETNVDLKVVGLNVPIIFFIPVTVKLAS